MKCGTVKQKRRMNCKRGVPLTKTAHMCQLSIGFCNFTIWYYYWPFHGSGLHFLSAHKINIKVNRGWCLAVFTQWGKQLALLVHRDVQVNEKASAQLLAVKWQLQLCYFNVSYLKCHLWKWLSGELINCLGHSIQTNNKTTLWNVNLYRLKIVSVEISGFELSVIEKESGSQTKHE